jgi:predicted permease
MKKNHPLSDLDADIRDHIERETQDNIERGMAPEEARHAALRKFGNVTLMYEDTRAVWIPVWLDQLRQDLRHTLRMIGRAPGFAAIAVGSSGLGIGACAVIFSILNFALLRPLPVDKPEQLMSLFERDQRTGEISSALSYPDLRDLREVRAFDGIAAHTVLPASLAWRGDPQRHWGSITTANYFAVVKPRFAIGRGFDASRDDTPGEPRVIVLSDDFWRRRFGGDPGIIGRTIAINQREATIIGVTAAGFRGTEVGFAPEFWIPFSMIEEHRTVAGIIDRVMVNRGRYWLTAEARLRPGVEPEVARAQLDVLARQLNATFANGNDDRRFHLERAGQLNPEFRTMARMLFLVSFGITALVMLAVCTNVANLLLGRAWARRREIAARMALGASRGRLLRQLLTESLLLAVVGSMVASVVAAYVLSLLGRVRIPLGWPLDLSITQDYRVLVFCIALSILTAVAFGLVPALRATRQELIANLKLDARGSAATGRFGLRNGLVVSQVAICTLLLVCMGLFLRSLHTAQQMDLGFANRNLLLLTFDPGLDRRPDLHARQLLREILERAQGVAGVESATLTTAVPLTFIVSNSRFIAAEHSKNPQAPRVRTDIYAVGPDFFRTMGIPFLSGVDFLVGQGATGRTAIVNDAFARSAFPNQSPIGRRVVGDGKSLEIVGVVATAKSRTIGEVPNPTIYLPILNDYAAAESPRGVTLVVKTTAGAVSYGDLMREAIRGADSSLAVFDVRTMETHLSEALIVPRVAWALSTVAGCIGAAIAIVGIYGVISFVVVRRRRELGIRLAIGARPSEISMMILKQGLSLALIGTVVGFLAAIGLTRFGMSLLYGVTPTDPTTFAVVPLVLMGVALLACSVPARAAARLDPVEVLRGE